jgi:signal peptidase I
VPNNSFFFLGDNRPNSRDARYWEQPFIEKEDIMGKAVFRFFPITRIGRLE